MEKTNSAQIKPKLVSITSDINDKITQMEEMQNSIRDKASRVTSLPERIDVKANPPQVITTMEDSLNAIYSRLAIMYDEQCYVNSCLYEALG